MRGSVIKRGDKYGIVYDVGRTTSGKRKQKWESGFKTKKEAEATLAKRIYEIENGCFIDYKSQKLSEYLQDWLIQHAPNVTPSTYRGYATNVHSHIIPVIGNVLLNQLKPVHVQKLYARKLEQGLSSTSVLYIHRVLHKALNQAVKMEIVHRNVADLVDPPRKRKFQAQILNESEVALLLSEAKDTPLYTPILLAVTLGLRRGEVLGLRWDDIDFSNNTITVRQTLAYEKGKSFFADTKTDASRRSILISASLINYLQNLLKNSMHHETVVSDKEGKPLNPNYMDRLFKQLLSKCGIKPIRFHDLRHTNATMMLKNNIPAKVASRRLGHSTIGITMDLYSHVLSEMQEDASKIFDKMINSQ